MQMHIMQVCITLQWANQGPIITGNNAITPLISGSDTKDISLAHTQSRNTIL